MFNKIMSGLGIQGVTVETRLHNPNLQAGETLHGEISFKGDLLIKKSMVFIYN
jgi:sporulation-control protein